MSDKTETSDVAEEIPGNEAAETAETHEHEPAKQTSGGRTAFLISLLALLLLGGSFFYLWQQQQNLRADLGALEGSIDKLSGVMERRHQEQLEQLRDIPEHPHPEINGRIEQNHAQLRQLQGRIRQLGSRVGQGQRDWVIAETEYLLGIAEHRLNLERDPRTARAALDAARTRLESLDSESFAAVIRQIDADIDKVSAIQLPDRAAMARELTTLATAVEALPLSPTAAAPSPSSGTDKVESEPPLPDTTWKAIWQKIWRDLRGLVTIRRQGEVERLTLPPEQRYFLRQNLQLKLESARFALLAGNSAAWQAALDESGTWLRRYFDTSSQPVITALDTLAQLAAVELEPVLPQLGETRALLQGTVLQQEPAAETETAPAEQNVAPAAETDPVPAAEPATEESSPPAAKESGGEKTAPVTEDLPPQPQGESL
ncbi:MAG: uroporphyrinogen-III C-methyltransferase [Gammaproteobacteria bacterium]|nr:uroporphyrinogen-III C-methyltransferase [Gammaproteobacteria bacterium]MCW8957490.1 uroporphyrinogen-III C-methyltransferase [Gammaproteobacteria bacterium]MCW8971992.1 uroporphyrinogen-III C-methyltransferase [Gammaproteobacteria bacterium]MCW8991967.1 uroporphyrinogen-III C-methyltransferase [Gammaproteobacteria bacterium]